MVTIGIYQYDLNEDSVLRAEEDVVRISVREGELGIE